MPTGQRKRINVSLLIPFLVVAMVFGLLIWKKYQATQVPVTPPELHQPPGERSAVLFFVAEGSRLTRESREMEPCGGTEACLAAVLGELINGPVGELDEALPEGTVLKSVHISGDTAVLDLNQAFADELASGSSAEMLAVYSLVDTACANFPHIAKVRLTVEGNEKVALKHLDLSDPIEPDYSLEQGIREPEAAQTPIIKEQKKGHK